MRVDKEYLDKLKKKFNVDILWSWSRYNSYHNDPYGYYLKYIKHIPETEKQSIWGISGGVVHSILEEYYEGKIKREDLLNEYEDRLFEMNSMELKYNKVNKEMNDNIADKYENSIRHFFENYKPITTKTILEQFVTIKIGKYIFQGYIDFIHKDGEENYIIEDFKTSTIYKGSKKENEAGQLLLYSQALLQRGIPIEKIKLRWNFLKYTDIKYKHMINVTYFKDDKNGGKITTSCCKKNEWVKKIATQLKKDLINQYPNLSNKEVTSIVKQCKDENSLESLDIVIQNKYTLSDVIKNGIRSQWVESIATQLKKDLKELGYDELEIEDLYQTCVENNNLDVLDDKIKNNYILEDCYVYINLNKDILNELNKNIINTLNEITENTDYTKELLSKLEGLDENSIDYKTINNKIDEMWWTEIDKNKEYYFWNLCGYNRNQHKPWDTYLKETEMFALDNKTEETIEDIVNNNSKEDDDLSWLNEL